MWVMFISLDCFPAHQGSCDTGMMKSLPLTLAGQVNWACRSELTSLGAGKITKGCSWSLRFGKKIQLFFSSSPLSKFILFQEKAERIPKYLSLNQSCRSIEFTVTLQLPLGIKNSHGWCSLSSYSFKNACVMPAGFGVRAPTTLNLW